MAPFWCLSLLILQGVLPQAWAQSGPKPQLTIQSGHSSRATAVAISLDGRLFATGSEDQTAKLWDLATGAELRTFQGHSGSVWSVAISPDGKLLATGSADRTAKLWDLATGRALRTFNEDSSEVRSVAFSPDGKCLAAGIFGGAKLWDLATGQAIRTFKGHSNEVDSAAFSPDGKHLITGSADRTAKLWDLATGQVIRTFQGHSGTTHSVAISQDGRYLVTGGPDKSAKLWDLATGQAIRTFKGHAPESGSEAAWPLASFDDAGRLEEDLPHPVLAAAFSPDGRHLVTGSSDNTAKLWDLATGQELRTFKGYPGDVTSVAISPDGKHLAATTLNTVVLWDLTTGKELPTFTGHVSAVNSVAFNPNGKQLAAGSADHGATIWDLAAGQAIRTFKRMYSWAKEVNSTAFSPDGKQLVTGGPDGAAQLWDVAAGQEIRAFKGDSSAVDSVAISPDGRYLAATGGGKVAKLWALATGQELRTFSDPSGGMRSVAFSPDGKQLATTGTTGYFDGTAKLWDLASGKELRTFQGHSSSVWSVAISPNGKQLATGSADRTAKIWALATGQAVRTFKGHADAVDSMAFSPDGKHLITGSSDNTAKLWDLAASQAIKTFRGHSGVVNSVAASPDGKHLATGSTDGTVRVWDLATGKELFALISMATGSVVVTPEGYFDGSPEAMKHIRWTAGFESYPMEAFSEGYYTPGLLSRIMVGETIADAGQPGLSKGFALPPLVKISSPKNGAQLATETVTVDVTATDQGGGIDEIRLFHNGKAVQGEARDIKVTATNAKDRTQAFRVTLVDGENRLRALAMSKDRIEGNPDEIAVTLKGLERQASLHVLVLGVNQYKNSAMNLNYAQPDAKSIAGFFGAAQSKLFKEVKLHELYDSAATKANILSKLDELKDTPPQDVVVVYLAGHGESLENVWYFIPHELTYPEREGEIKAKGLSSAELQAAVKAMGAQKILLLMDACKSGGALLAFAGRGVEDRKALAMLARAAGVHVVAASTDNQIAAEVKDLGHGVFTYTLLQGLAGQADGSPKDGTVTVRELLSYVESQLPEISQKYKTQAQYPVVDSRGMDFPVASGDR